MFVFYSWEAKCQLKIWGFFYLKKKEESENRYWGRLAVSTNYVWKKNKSGNLTSLKVEMTSFLKHLKEEAKHTQIWKLQNALLFKTISAMGFLLIISTLIIFSLFTIISISILFWIITILQDFSQSPTRTQLYCL